jgi:aromatic ring-cleaving dioxygenase
VTQDDVGADGIERVRHALHARGEVRVLGQESHNRATAPTPKFDFQLSFESESG